MKSVYYEMQVTANEIAKLTKKLHELLVKEQRIKRAQELGLKLKSNRNTKVLIDANLNVSTRTYNVLKYIMQEENIKTLDELAEKPLIHYAKYRNAGYKVIAELEQLCIDNGIAAIRDRNYFNF